MNEKCEGDLFTANGTIFYRCFGYGSITIIESTTRQRCPSCRRPITADDHGVVDEKLVLCFQLPTNPSVLIPVGGSLKDLLELKDAEIRKRKLAQQLAELRAVNAELILSRFKQQAVAALKTFRTP